MTVDDIWQAKLDENPHFEDEYGFFMHMEAGGTLISLAMMLAAGPLMRLLGTTGTNVANRLLGVVLGALAVQFVIDGIRASFG